MCDWRLHPQGAEPRQGHVIDHGGSLRATELTYSVLLPRVESVQNACSSPVLVVGQRALVLLPVSPVSAGPATEPEQPPTPPPTQLCHTPAPEANPAFTVYIRVAELSRVKAQEGQRGPALAPHSAGPEDRPGPGKA